MSSISSAGSSSTEQLQSFEPEPVCSTGAGEPPAESASAPAQAKAPEAKDEVVEHHQEQGAWASMKEWVGEKAHHVKEVAEQHGWDIEVEKGGDRGIGGSAEPGAKYADDVNDPHHMNTVAPEREKLKVGFLATWKNWDAETTTLAKGENYEATRQYKSGDARVFAGYTEKPDGSKELGIEVSGQASAMEVNGKFKKNLKLADENGGMRDLKAEGKANYLQAEGRVGVALVKTEEGYGIRAGGRGGLNLVNATSKVDVELEVGDEKLGRVGLRSALSAGGSGALEIESIVEKNGHIKNDWKFGMGEGPGGAIGMVSDIDMKATARMLIKEADQGSTHMVSQLGAGMGHVSGKFLTEEAGDLEARAAKAEAGGSSVKAGLLHASAKAASFSGRAANAFGDMHAVIRDATAKDESWVNQLPGIGKTAPTDDKSTKPSKKGDKGTDM